MYLGLAVSERYKTPDNVLTMAFPEVDAKWKVKTNIFLFPIWNWPVFTDFTQPFKLRQDSKDTDKNMLLKHIIKTTTLNQVVSD